MDLPGTLSEFTNDRRDIQLLLAETRCVRVVPVVDEEFSDEGVQFLQVMIDRTQVLGPLGPPSILLEHFHRGILTHIIRSSQSGANRETLRPTSTLSGSHGPSPTTSPRTDAARDTPQPIPPARGCYRTGGRAVYVQRIDASGTVQWTTNGVILCAALGNQSGVQITSDAAGEAIVTWWDERSGNYDIHAQHVNHIYAQHVNAEVPVTPAGLCQSYPNPFNPSTSINYDLAATCRARIDIFYAAGLKMVTLVDRIEGPGHDKVTWDGHDSKGDPIGSEVYFYKLVADKKLLTKKMIPF